MQVDFDLKTKDFGKLGSQTPSYLPQGAIGQHILEDPFETRYLEFSHKSQVLPISPSAYLDQIGTDLSQQRLYYLETSLLDTADHFTLDLLESGIWTAD